MMTNTKKLDYDPKAFSKNLTQIAEKSQLVLQEFLSHQTSDRNPALSSAFAAGEAFTEMLTKLWSDPARVWDLQMDYYKNYMMVVTNVMDRMMGKSEPPIYQSNPRDRRFQDVAWSENLLFDFIKQSYLLTSEWMQKTVHSVEDELDQKTAHRVDFYTRQLIDAMAPSNFVMTNPEVLRTTVDTQGKNLVKGLENLLGDLEKSKHMLKISTTDPKAFKVGVNIANTPGKVIFQNDLLQLIQYSPLTDNVYKTPLLIIAPWINKYYVLDLSPENSFIRWLASQGHTVFVTSWVNPDTKLRNKSFEDYMVEGALAAMDAVTKATGEERMNIIGYCLGGTLLSATLAYLTEKGQENRVASATFLTTLVDFSIPGDIGVFIDEVLVEEIEAQMKEEGYYDGTEMAATFNALRANDMIWSFVINNYLLGKDPFPFDLLYWNADSTRLPAAMHSFYLRNMYLNNKVVKPGGITLKGVPIDVRKITTPSYLLSTREDHIAPWKGTYKVTSLYNAPITFTLCASGHIAGVINPPVKKKYCFWVNDTPIKAGAKWPEPDTWLKSANEHAGSWWPHWQEWSQKFAGQKVPARKPGDGKLKPIEDAPGSYVQVRCQ